MPVPVKCAGGKIQENPGKLWKIQFCSIHSVNFNLKVTRGPSLTLRMWFELKFLPFCLPKLKYPTESLKPFQISFKFCSSCFFLGYRDWRAVFHSFLLCQRELASSELKYTISESESAVGLPSQCLSFFLGFQRPNLITGLSGWLTPD